MWYIIIRKYIYIINLLEILVYVCDHEHHLIINAKFHRSMINNAHTMSLADKSAAPQKSYGQQYSF